MANAFQLFGSLHADTSSFRKSLTDADRRLDSTASHLVEVERLFTRLGSTSSVQARSIERFRESFARLSSQTRTAAAAFQQGVTTSRQYETQMRSLARSTDTLNSRLKDHSARLMDAGNKQSSFITKMTGAVAVGNLAAQAVFALGGAVRSGAESWLTYAANMEQTKLSFTTLAKDAGVANQHLGELKTLAANTSLDFGSITKMSQGLQGAGVEISKITPLIMDIGNAAAATGDMSAERMEGIATAMRQIASKGRVSAEEMEQLSERGVPGWLMLSKAIGKTVAETRKLAEDGKINADLLFEAFSQYSKLNFGDAMEKQARTFTGAWANISNVVSLSLNDTFAPLFEQIRDLAVRMSQDIRAQQGDFTEIGKVIAGYIGEGLAGALIGATTGFGSWLLDSIVAPFKAMAEGKNPLTSQLGGKMLGGFLSGMGQSLGLVDKAVVAPFQQASKSISETSKHTENLKDRIKGLPSVPDQIKADVAENQVKTLRDTALSLATQIRFFGDESEVAGAKQRLLGAGISDWTSRSSAAILSMAEMLDGLKAQKKAQDEYAKSLESARDKLRGFREDADFKMAFTNPTELDKFNNWVKQSAANFRELKSEIDVTRERLTALVTFDAAKDRGAALRHFKGFITDLQRTVSGSKIDVDFDEMFSKNVKDALSAFDLDDSELAKISAFAKKAVERLGAAFRGEVAGSQSEWRGFIQEGFANFKTTAGIQIFPDNVDNLERFVEIWNATSKSVSDARSQVADDVLSRFGGNLKKLADGSIATFTPLDELNKMLSSPDVSMAIRDRAQALGILKEQLVAMMQRSVSPQGIAELTVSQELAQSLQEIANLKQRISKYSNFQALEVEKAQLQEIVALRQAETQKIIEANTSLADRIRSMSANAVSMSTQLKDTFANAISGIADVFGNAVAQWDGTIGGFFKSVAQGFAQMAKQIASDMIRLLVYKALLSLFNAVAGSFGGGGGLDGIDVGAGNVDLSASFAKGGFTGHGGVKDIAGFVHGKEFVMPSEAVRHFGLSFMESIRNLQMPSLAPGFAGGGFTGGGFMPSMMAGNATSNTFNNQRSNVFNINVSGGGQNSARTADQIRREVIRGLHETEMRSK